MYTKQSFCKARMKKLRAFWLEEPGDSERYRKKKEGQSLKLLLLYCTRAACRFAGLDDQLFDGGQVSCTLSR